MTIRFTKAYKKYTIGQLVSLPPKVEYTLIEDGIADLALDAEIMQSGIFMSEVTPYVNRTTTGTVFSGPCELAGYDVISVTGSPTITIYDNTSAAGTIIVPTTTLVVGRVEFNYKRALVNGCHVVLSGTQNVNILVG